MNISKAYSSYEELLIDREVDAIYNPLPVSMHAQWSIKAAEKGKSVLCEKPLALNSAEVKNMIRVFADKNLLLSEALMYRYHPLTEKFLSLMKNGVIGKVQTMQSYFTVNITNPADIRFKKETGGGALLDLGVYCVSILRYMAGEEPLTVKGLARLNEDGVDTSFAGVLKFPSYIGSFNCSLTAQFSCGYSVFGSMGIMVVEYGGMVPWPGEEFTIKLWRKGNYEEIFIPAANHYRLMVEDFNNAILNGTTMRFSIRDTLNNTKVIDVLYANIIEQ